MIQSVPHDSHLQTVHEYCYEIGLMYGEQMLDSNELLMNSHQLSHSQTVISGHDPSLLLTFKNIS